MLEGELPHHYLTHGYIDDYLGWSSVGFKM